MESKKNAVYIDTDSLVSSIEDEAVQALVCQICLGIVYHPVECEGCQTLFCSAEIEQLKGLCPLCKSEKWKQTEYIHRSYKTKLLGLQLRCPAATCPLNQEKLSYEKYIKHVPTCQFVLFKPKPEHDLEKLLSNIVQPGDKKFYQFSYADGLGSKPYPEHDNVSLNLNFHKGNKVFQLNGYTISLQKKEQMNQTTKNRRPIRIEQVVGHKPQCWWYTTTDKNEFAPYDIKCQNGIESTYRLFLKNKKPTYHRLRLLNREYHIDFEKMQQMNPQTKKSRPVHRVLL